MSINVAGSPSGNVAEVDTTFKALRATLRPPEVLSWNSIGLKSGLITGTGVIAGAPLFGLRYVGSGSNVLLVRRLGIGIICSTAFGSAQTVDMGAYVARSWSADDSGGTAVAISGNNGKHRTSLATPNGVGFRIATTTLLTAGSRTVDGNPLGIGSIWAIAAATLQPAPDNLIAHNEGDYPVVLASDEGILIEAVTAFGATGVVTLYVNVEYAEAAAF